MANPSWMPQWLQDIINTIDDPFDNFKHWWHGHKWKVFGRCYQTWAYMSNHPHTKWEIKRIECDGDK